MTTILELETKPLLLRAGGTPQPSTLVATGTHRESRLALYTCAFDSQPRASVFIYPAHFQLTPEIISNHVNERFSHMEKIIEREFEDLSVEEVQQTFVRAAKPAISSATNTYPFRKAQIIEECYALGSEAYLRGIIEDLKP